MARDSKKRKMSNGRKEMHLGICTIHPPKRTNRNIQVFFRRNSIGPGLSQEVETHQAAIAAPQNGRSLQRAVAWAATPAAAEGREGRAGCDAWESRSHCRKAGL